MDAFAHINVRETANITVGTFAMTSILVLSFKLVESIVGSIWTHIDLFDRLEDFCFEFATISFFPLVILSVLSSCLCVYLVGERGQQKFKDMLPKPKMVLAKAFNTQASKLETALRDVAAKVTEIDTLKRGEDEWRIYRSALEDRLMRANSDLHCARVDLDCVLDWEKRYNDERFSHNKTKEKAQALTEALETSDEKNPVVQQLVAKADKKAAEVARLKGRIAEFTEHCEKLRENLNCLKDKLISAKDHRTLMEKNMAFQEKRLKEMHMSMSRRDLDHRAQKVRLQKKLHDVSTGKSENDRIQELEQKLAEIQDDFEPYMAEGRRLAAENQRMKEEGTKIYEHNTQLQNALDAVKEDGGGRGSAEQNSLKRVNAETSEMLKALADIEKGFTAGQESGEKSSPLAQASRDSGVEDVNGEKLAEENSQLKHALEEANKASTEEIQKLKDETVQMDLAVEYYKSCATDSERTSKKVSQLEEALEEAKKGKTMGHSAVKEISQLKKILDETKKASEQDGQRLKEENAELKKALQDANKTSGSEAQKSAKKISQLKNSLQASQNAKQYDITECADEKTQLANALEASHSIHAADSQKFAQELAQLNTALQNAQSFNAGLEQKFSVEISQVKESLDQATSAHATDAQMFNDEVANLQERLQQATVARDTQAQQFTAKTAELEIKLKIAKDVIETLKLESSNLVSTSAADHTQCEHQVQAMQQNVRAEYESKVQNMRSELQAEMVNAAIPVEHTDCKEQIEQLTIDLQRCQQDYESSCAELDATQYNLDHTVERLKEESKQQLMEVKDQLMFSENARQDNLNNLVDISKKKGLMDIEHANLQKQLEATVAALNAAMGRATDPDNPGLDLVRLRSQLADALSRNDRLSKDTDSLRQRLREARVKASAADDPDTMDAGIDSAGSSTTPSDLAITRKKP